MEQKKWVRYEVWKRLLPHGEWECWSEAASETDAKEKAARNNAGADAKRRGLEYCAARLTTEIL